MKIIRCDNNKHFYDADLYDACPHCRKEQAGVKAISKNPSPHTESEKSSKCGNNPVLSEPKSESDIPLVQNSMIKLEQKNSSTVFCTNCGKAISTAKRFCTNCGTKLRVPETSSEQDFQPQARFPVKYTDENHTSSIWEHKNNKTPDDTENMLQVSEIDNVVGEKLTESHNKVQINEEPTAQSDFPLPPPIEASSQKGEDNKEEDLLQAVAAVTSHSASEDAKTVAFYDFGGEESPIVGWLVCVKGEYQGQGFDLKSGQNYIGRAQNMNIALAREASVSRNRHSVIIFDPIKKSFYIQQGESSGLTYLNGELVMEHIQLNTYDKIKLGNAEFIFVPFCNDKFSWDDYINK